MLDYYDLTKLPQFIGFYSLIVILHYIAILLIYIYMYMLVKESDLHPCLFYILPSPRNYNEL